MRYTFAIWFQLPFYAIKRRRYYMAFKNVVLTAIFFFWVSHLYKFNPIATTWVFIAPFLVSSFLLMFGNWCQHILVDPKQPDNSYVLTYNLINSPANMESYNDGYHIIHHLNSKLHWSELPDAFLKDLEKWPANQALTFEKLEFMDVGWYIFTKQYTKLAKYYVPIGNKSLSEQELIQIFKERVKPIPVN